MDEWNESLIQSSVERAEKLGPINSGKVHVAGSSALAVSRGMLDDKEAFVADNRSCLMPKYIQDRLTGRIVAKAYTKAEYGAVKDGRYCIRCDEKQQSQPPSWAVADFRCDPHRGRGCGFPRGWDAWKMLPYEVFVIPSSADAGQTKE